MRDLGTRADLEVLLRDFYDRAFADPLLGHVFVDVVHMDLEHHLPVITDFWQKVLFDVGTYDGRAMRVHQHVHARVPLTEQHFTRWLQLWREALDARFAGPVTEQAAAHATRIAAAIAKHLDVASASASGPAAPGRGRPVLPLVARRDDLVQVSRQPGGTSRRQA